MYYVYIHSDVYLGSSIYLTRMTIYREKWTNAACYARFIVALSPVYLLLPFNWKGRSLFTIEKGTCYRWAFLILLWKKRLVKKKYEHSYIGMRRRRLVKGPRKYWKETSNTVASDGRPTMFRYLLYYTKWFLNLFFSWTENAQCPIALFLFYWATWVFGLVTHFLWSLFDHSFSFRSRSNPSVSCNNRKTMHAYVLWRIRRLHAR